MAIVRNSFRIGSGGGGAEITVVANYSALPDPTTVSGLFYWVSNSQGTKWLPGSLGGTYYNSGLYYSNGTTWEFMNVPYQATQLEVDTGTNTDKFVTPSTLSNSTWAFTTAKTLATLLTGISFATGGAIVSTDTVLIAFGKIQKQINDLSTVYQAILTSTNFGAFSNSLTDKTTPVDADTINLSDSADSNKSKKLSFTNLKAFLKTYFDGLYLVPTITITTSVSIDTNTTASGFGQHGRNTKISNSTNAINITCETSSNADFVASYTKIGTGTITFVAGSGATIVQLPTGGGVALTGIVGSNARLTRNGNTFYLELNNY